MEYRVSIPSWRTCGLISVMRRRKRQRANDFPNEYDTMLRKAWCRTGEFFVVRVVPAHCISLFRLWMNRHPLFYTVHVCTSECPDKLRAGTWKCCLDYDNDTDNDDTTRRKQAQDSYSSLSSSTSSTSSNMVLWRLRHSFLSFNIMFFLLCSHTATVITIVGSGRFLLSGAGVGNISPSGIPV